MRLPRCARLFPGAQSRHVSLAPMRQFVVHFHTERLKNLRRWMTPPVADDDFFDHAHERKRFAKRRDLARLYDRRRDAARRRFLAEVAKQMSELFLTVIVNDVGRGCDLM